MKEHYFKKEISNKFEKTKQKAGIITFTAWCLEIHFRMWTGFLWVSNKCILKVEAY